MEESQDELKKEYLNQYGRGGVKTEGSENIEDKNRGDPGIEPGTSCTRSKNHTTRPIAQITLFSPTRHKSYPISSYQISFS